MKGLILFALAAIFAASTAVFADDVRQQRIYEGWARRYGRTVSDDAGALSATRPSAGRYALKDLADSDDHAFPPPASDPVRKEIVEVRVVVVPPSGSGTPAPAVAPSRVSPLASSQSWQLFRPDPPAIQGNFFGAPGRYDPVVYGMYRPSYSYGYGYGGYGYGGYGYGSGYANFGYGRCSGGYGRSYGYGSYGGRGSYGYLNYRNHRGHSSFSAGGRIVIR